jgi:hypothetical protein
MMMLWEILFAIGIALVMTAIFAVLFRRTGPWASYLVFFAIIFLGAWAAGVWLAPLGPHIFGVYWIPFLVFGLIFALLLAAMVGPSPPSMWGRRVGAVEQREREEPTSSAGYDLFFGALLIVFMAAIIFGYLFR